MQAFVKLVVVLATLSLLVSCPSGRQGIPLRDPDAGVSSSATDPVRGLVFRLAHADAPASRRRPGTVADAVALGDAKTAAVLARLPPLVTDPSDAREVALRPGARPPPRTGTTVDAAFPPEVPRPTTSVPSPGPLEVVRFAPEGEVGVAPHLAVTFSHPMVPVTSLDTLAAKDVPVVLEPQPAGTWRWIGTRTLLFEPAERFPMASRYRVSIPAGTKSAVGSSTGKGVSWGFATTPPALQAFVPREEFVRSRPVFFATFDQRIDRAAVLEKLSISVGGSTWPVRLATPEEVDADDDVRRLAAQEAAGRWIAFVPVRPLPSDANVRVTFGAGTPSAEGPLRTVEAQEVELSTWRPLKVQSHGCGSRAKCSPDASLRIELNNAIDVETFSRSMLAFSPALPDAEVEVDENVLRITAPTKPRTTYWVTLSGALSDNFGQRLGEDETIRWRVGEATPSLFAAGSRLVVLDPEAEPRLSVFTVNQGRLRVRLWKVDPEDWTAYVASVVRTTYDSADPPLLGRGVLDTTISPRGRRNEVVETAIDLSAALDGGVGNVVVAVEPARPEKSEGFSRIYTWVQATQIGLQAHVDDERVLVWATALRDGRPLEGVHVELSSGARAVTDARGLASLDLDSEAARFVAARKGKDWAFLPESSDSASWRRKPAREALSWYVVGDRKLYRPGESVHVKGWIRMIDAGKGGDVGPAEVRHIDYRLVGPRREELRKGRLALNAFGAFDTELALPEEMPLGQARLELEARTTSEGMQGREHSYTFEVQEFRRPEYEVTTRFSGGPHVVGAHAVATVTAGYYAGGGLPDAGVDWIVRSSPAYYQPPGHRDYVFGKHEPPWTPNGGHDIASSVSRREAFSARTDATGEHHLRVDFVSGEPNLASVVTADATIHDVDRRAWRASSATIVHPSTRYVGLRVRRAFVRAGRELEVDAIVVGIDGEVHEGVPISIRAVRMVSDPLRGETVEHELDVPTCERVSALEPVSCSLPVRSGGTWKVVATVRDPEGRSNRTETTTLVLGGTRPALRHVEQEQVRLVRDRERYEIGQTAMIAVSAPWPNARGLVTLRRSGLVEERTIELHGTSTVLEVPIEDAMTPNVHVQVDLVGAAPRTDEDGRVADLPPRPAYATGSVTLPVPPRRRALTVRARPAVDAMEPGGSTTVEIDVRDADDTPVSNAEVALVVVDEAVLALTGHRLPDPLATFHPYRWPLTSDYHLREHVLVGRREQLATGEDSDTDLDDIAGRAATRRASSAPANATPQILRADRDEARTPVATRSDFSALASFSPSVPTDASGRAVVEVRLPDNLTRYRITAIAVEGERRFGLGESVVTARLPLMVRPSPPRFLNFGDELELPVLLQNQTDAPMTVDLAMRATHVELTAGAGRRVELPANDRIEVRFSARANRAGTARFQVVGVSEASIDAASFELPVRTPATTEAFAVYGEIDDGAIVQPVQPPEGVLSQFGGLEITTSSTALQALTDAVLYLSTYPYDLSEPIASRVLAVAALRSVLEAFQAEGLPSHEQLVESMHGDLERLARMQNVDGGFAYGGVGSPSAPFLTAHIAHALTRADQAGFSVPRRVLPAAHAYLHGIERSIDPETPESIARATRAYASYVLDLGGSPDPTQARALVGELPIEEQSFETLAWVLPTLHADPASRALAERILRHFENRAMETAATAHFATDYGDDAHLLLHSDRRTDALVLEAMLRTTPRHDLVPKIVRGLLGHRRAGRWSNTQENTFVLLALEQYFRTHETTPPRFVARAWLGRAFAGEHAFRGHTTERHHVRVPMQWLQDGTGGRELVLAKEGQGRLYYRIGMRYAPADFHQPPFDAGFAVARHYEAVDDPTDVRRQDDGTWKIRAGARVRVRVRMVAPTRRHHVALVDPLPAGFEPQNPVFAAAGVLQPDPQGRFGSPWRFRHWYEHHDMREDRIEVFSRLLAEGVYVYDHVARATTPGRFIVPPPRVEEMYHPETFGHGASDVVIVE
jgi:alpha-2-macroglobulin